MPLTEDLLWDVDAAPQAPTDGLSDFSSLMGEMQSAAWYDRI